MKTFKITNPPGFGTSVNQTIKDSFDFYGKNYIIKDGEYEGYGNPEYTIIKTGQDIDSNVMRAIEYHAQIKEIK